MTLSNYCKWNVNGWNLLHSVCIHFSNWKLSFLSAHILMFKIYTYSNVFTLVYKCKVLCLQPILNNFWVYLVYNTKQPWCENWFLLHVCVHSNQHLFNLPPLWLLYQTAGELNSVHTYLGLKIILLLSNLEQVLNLFETQNTI